MAYTYAFVSVLLPWLLIAVFLGMALLGLFDQKTAFGLGYLTLLVGFAIWFILTAVFFIQTVARGQFWRIKHILLLIIMIANGPAIASISK